MLLKSGWKRFYDGIPQETIFSPAIQETAIQQNIDGALKSKRGTRP